MGGVLMSKQDRTDTCYQHDDHNVAITTPTVAGTPMRKPMTRTADGVTISRREYKLQRALAKSLKRKINGSR